MLFSMKLQQGDGTDRAPAVYTAIPHEMAS